MHEYFDHEEAKRFFKLSAVAVLLLSLFLTVKTLGAFKEWRQPGVASNTIVVTGQGEAFATPDIASFTFSVTADADTVGKAQGEVTMKTNAVLDALKALGIEEKDIRTTDYSVYPKYKYLSMSCGPNYCPPSRQLPDGYTVTHTVSIKIRKTDDAGKALAVAGDKGASNISSLAFTIDNPDSVMNEARDKAVANAREKAKVLARSLGVSLGRVVDFSDSTYNPGPYPMYAREQSMGSSDGKVAPPTVPSGENKVTSNVTITYEIR